MNDDLRYYGNPMNWESTKGDLISREALKETLAREIKTNDMGLWLKILLVIDNAPTVEYTFEEAFQKTICEQKLYCPARPKGKWIIDGHHIRCNRCNEYICNTDREGDKIPDNFCPNCGAAMRGDKE